MALANRNRAGNLAEDFGSYAVIQSLTEAYAVKHGADKLTYEWVGWRWTDFLRESFGDTRLISGKLKSDSRLKYSEITEEEFDDDGRVGVQVEGEIKPESVPLAVKVADQHGIKDWPRVVFLLKYHYGFLDHEIGMLMGISAGTVSFFAEQVVGKIKKID